FLEDAEHRRVVQLFNRTQSPYPRDKSIHELFEEQARLTPTRTAVEQDGLALSYAALNRRANQLARCLMGMGLRPDELVATFVRRSVAMVVGMLGVLKAGGAYVPLDPTYPLDRLQYM